MNALRKLSVSTKLNPLKFNYVTLMLVMPLYYGSSIIRH